MIQAIASIQSHLPSSSLPQRGREVERHEALEPQIAPLEYPVWLQFNFEVPLQIQVGEIAALLAGRRSFEPIQSSPPLPRLVPVQEIKYLDCQNYAHTATELKPCAIHPGETCQGCTDYNPHPLGGVFDFSQTVKIIVQGRYFQICNTKTSWDGYISYHHAWQSIVATAFRNWYEDCPTLSPLTMYFAGDREQYEKAIAHLEVNSLPHLVFDGCQSHKIYIFYAATTP